MTLVPEFFFKSQDFPHNSIEEILPVFSGDAAKVTNPWSLASTKERGQKVTESNPTPPLFVGTFSSKLT